MHALAAGNTYYVDCSAATNGSGTQASPWNNLDTVNGTTFASGDQILFKRGMTCTGQLAPLGSGSSGSPITASAYGTGARPIIDGNNAVDPVVHLFNQQYWVIDSFEVKNTTGKGVFIDGSAGASLTYFRLTNLYIHNCGLGDSDDAILAGMYQNHSVHDVVIDNADTSLAFRGIEIGGPSPIAGAARSSNITIQNSLAHDVQSDGMLMASANNALAQYNVVYRSGIMTTLINHTPNGLWTWDCDSCVVQYNEVYSAQSPSWDGGSYDIDYFTHHNIIQYNYGHDNNAYCASIFGGDNSDVTTDNTIRYNICSNDVRIGTQKATRQGEIYLTVWSHGSIQDSYIYNNTIYFNPVATSNGPYYAINSLNIFHGTAINNTNIYNNIVYAADPHLVDITDFTSQTHMDNNLYWYTGAGSPSFLYGVRSYTSLSAWKTGSGQDAHGIYADPLLNNPTYHSVGKPVSAFTLQNGSPAINAAADLVALGKVGSMGSQDFFGNPIPQSGAYDVGAYESGSGGSPTNTPSGPTNTPTIQPPTNTPTGPTNTPVPPTNTPTPGSDVNLALNKPWPASSTENSSYLCSNAFDGNVGTRWWTLKNSTLSTEWISVDLGSAVSISSVSLNQGDRWATSYTIDVSSDNINWTSVYSTTSGVTGTVTIPFTPTTARFVRMNSTVWHLSTDRVKLYEFQVFQ